MTIGISIYDLLEIDPWQYDNQQDVLNAILGQCTELNPWLPIEQAPKDRSVLAWSKPDGYEVAYWSTSVWVDKGGSWIACENRSDTQILHPTHYQELPGDPD